MAQIIAPGTSADTSADIVLSYGQAATISLFQAGGGQVPNDCVAYIQQKSSNGTYADAPNGQIDSFNQSAMIIGASTWRVRKPASTNAFGVDSV